MVVKILVLRLFFPPKRLQMTPGEWWVVMEVSYLFRGDEFSIPKICLPEMSVHSKMNKTVPIVRTYVGCIATFLSRKMTGNNFLHLEPYGLRSKMGLNHGMPLVSYLVVVDKHQ